MPADHPELSRHERIEFYRWMRLTREFDDRMVAMWKQGRGVGGTFSGRGHEAISVGAATTMARWEAPSTTRVSNINGKGGRNACTRVAITGTASMLAKSP